MAAGVAVYLRRLYMARQMGDTSHLTPAQRQLLGLDAAPVNPAAAAAKAKAAAKSAAGAASKAKASRARSAGRAEGKSPAAAGSGQQSRRFERVGGLEALSSPRTPGTPGRGATSLHARTPQHGTPLHLDTLNATIIAPTSEGRVPSQARRFALSPPGRVAPRTGRPAGESVFDAGVVEALLGHQRPGQPRTGGTYQVAQRSGLDYSVGVAGRDRVQAELGISLAALEGLQRPLKTFLAWHIQRVFLPTLDANVRSLHTASAEHSSSGTRHRLPLDFLRRSDARAGRVRLPSGEAKSLGELLDYYTRRAMGHMYFYAKRHLNVTSLAREGADLYSGWGMDGAAGNGALPEEATRFWLASADPGKYRRRARSASRSGGSRAGGDGGSVDSQTAPGSVAVNVHLWYERARLEGFLDLAGRYAGTSQSDEAVKRYVLRRLEHLAADGELGAFKGGGEAATSGHTGAAAHTASSMPSDSQIILAYFISMMDSLLTRFYPGEVGDSAVGLRRVLELDSTNASHQRRFSRRHVCSVRTVPEGATSGHHPVLHVVSGLAAREVHCRLVLNDVSYDCSMESSADSHARVVGEPDASLWRTLCLLLTLMHRVPEVMAHFAPPHDPAGHAIRKVLLDPIFDNATEQGAEDKLYSYFSRLS